jgi:opacity protein-like surface antigen
MSFKKLITSLLSVFLLCTASLAFAGGNYVPDSNPPVADPIDYSGVYVDFGLGYALVNWKDASTGAFNNFSPTVTGGTSSNGNGGFSFGVDVGYQINRYLGLEFGWYYLPKVKGNTDVMPALQPLTIKSWAAYLALKGMVPITRKLDIFVKVGPAYRYLRYSATGSTMSGFGSQSNQYWTLMAGAGLQYWLDENWVVAVQYIYIGHCAETAKITRQAPAANLVLVNLGYKFSL